MASGRLAFVAAASAVVATLVWLHRSGRSKAGAPVQEEELIAVLDRARQLGLLTERAEDLLWNALDDSETTVEALLMQWTARVEAFDAEPGHGAVELDEALQATTFILDEALQAAQDEPIAHKHPIHAALCTDRAYASSWLELCMRSPANWEPLEKRLRSLDPTSGCFDPTELGTEAGRDWVEVRVRLSPDAEWRALRLPAYAAHLVDGSQMWDPEASGTPAEATFWSDGTWSGSLVWDSAVHVVEFMLSDAMWRRRVRGACVLELGCGLALPGLVAHLLGARAVLLTDRRVIADMVGEAVAINSLPAETVRAFELDWAPGAAAPVLATHLGGGAPDVIVSCDCIFADLFDSNFLLLDVLSEIASPATAILLGFERRPGDGVERFFAQAAARGFRTTLRRRSQRVLVCELRLVR
jgi:predicted nicotinamide N-methyase